MMKTPGTLVSYCGESSGKESESGDRNFTPMDSTKLRDGIAPSRAMIM